MAVCEQGYLCEVCGGDVAEITESDLYLRYVLGEVDPETLHACPERHIRCNPTLAQFIVAEGFAPVAVEGPFAKAGLDPAFVASEEVRVSPRLSAAPRAAGGGRADHRVSVARGPGALAGPAGSGGRPTTAARRARRYGSRGMRRIPEILCTSVQTPIRDLEGLTAALLGYVSFQTPGAPNRQLRISSSNLKSRI